MKELVFLPDRDGRDNLGSGEGFVRCGAHADELLILADRLATPLSAAGAMNKTEWRSRLTLALLADVWEGCGTELSALTVDGSASAFSAWVLAARHGSAQGKPVHLLLAVRGDVRKLLGVADEALGLRLPETPGDVRDVMPPRATWYDAETGALQDPVPFLCERDRAILLGRMAQLNLTAPAAADYMEALAMVDQQEIGAVCELDDAALERLAVRTEAVCGLASFDAFAVQEDTYASGGSNPLMQCLGAAEAELREDLGNSCTYLWNGTPFARTDSSIGLTGTPQPGVEEALAQITGELTIMSGCSVGWNHTTGRALQKWLDARQGQLLPQAKERIEASCSLMLANARQVQTTVTLNWPWDAASGAVRHLLQEALGEKWMNGAATPFADRLTLLKGYGLGDNTLQACCAWQDGVLLPPLSREMAACVANADEGGGLALDALRFAPEEDGSITASFLLRGQGEICMVRRYAPEDILTLELAEAPSVAVWPCLPMVGWTAYHVFVKGGVEVAAEQGGTWVALAPQPASMPVDAPVDEEDGAAVPQPEYTWRSLRVTQYPQCLLLMKDGLTLGALPNMLPAWRTQQEGDAVVGIDMGSSQTVVALSIGGKAEILEGRELCRILTAPADMTEDSFLENLTPTGVVPTAAHIAGEGRQLFLDGYAFRPESIAALAAMDASALRTTLKWRSDKESVQARELLLHQVMLGAALTAVLKGARSISWRITIADEMGDEGREAMLRMMDGLSAEVARESGLPLTEGVPAVSWAEESSALCACLRSEGTGRGTFVSLDLGGASTKLHLWMQGQNLDGANRPTAGAVVLEGLLNTLTASLRQQPRRLLDDFADCGNEELLKAVLALVEQLNPDLWSLRQQDKIGLMLGMMLDGCRPAVVQHMHARTQQQNPTYMQSLLLETLAATLFTAGLMLAQAGDNVNISHRLPEDITVCLTGRGAWLLDTLSPAMRNSLQHLAHTPMRINHPVRFMTLRAAGKPLHAAAIGLCGMKQLGKLNAPQMIRTRESFSGLMQQFVLQMIAAFPAHMWALHEGLFDWQGVLTPAGADTIRRVASRCYGDGDDIPAAILAFVRELRTEPILPEQLVQTGV